MNRFIISLSLFFIVCLGCIVGVSFLNDFVNELDYMIESIEEEADNDNIDSAIKLNESIYQKWQEKQAFISTFVDHSKLSQIDQDILCMKTNLVHDQIEDFYVYSAMTKSHLNSLIDLELPLIEHIL